MKKILLTGVHGQVGHALQQSLSRHQVIALDRATLDLTDTQKIRSVVREIKPALIINPAAYTAVDKAESEPALADAINAIAPGVLAEEAARLGAALVHFSTDYVYDGTKASPYLETDPVNPVSIYGQSKLAGEAAIRAVGLPYLILRTSWVYGNYGHNFMKTILRLAKERENLRIVADQFGAPTADIAIADAVAQLVSLWQPEIEEQTGVYHLVNTGETSWHGFATEIVLAYAALAQEKTWPALAVKQIEPIASHEYPTPAKRPANSRLSTEKLHRVFGLMLPEWRTALNQIMQQHTL